MTKTGSPETVGFSASRLKRIDTLMQRYVDQNKLAGIVTLAARRGSVVHFGSYGYQDLVTRKPMSLDTIFRIYSMTKPITSVALMMLYEHGLFQLRDPVSRFVPEFKTLKVWVNEGELADLEREITIHDLLTHTAGLTYGGYEATQMPVDKLYDRSDLWSPDITNQEMVRRITELPLAHQPGEVWHYSVATSVVGYIVELISGMSLGEFFRERIFGPLGMDDTDFSVPSEKIERLATLFGLTEEGPLGVIEPDPWGCDFIDTRLQYGGGGLVATAGDYVRFAQLLLNKGELDGVRLLGSKTVQLMTTNHLPSTLLPMKTPEPLPGLGFGLGFSVAMDIAQLGILGSVGACGWSGMAGTDFWIDPQEQLVGILLLQYIPYGTYPVASEFRTLVYQALVD